MKALSKTYSFIKKKFENQWSYIQFKKENMSNPIIKSNPVEKEKTDVYYYEEEDYSLLSSQQDIREKKMQYFLKKMPDLFQNLLQILLFLYLVLKTAEIADTLHNQKNIETLFKDVFENHSQFHTTLYLVESLIGVIFITGYLYSLWQFFTVFDICYLKKYVVVSLILFTISVILECSQHFNQQLKINPKYLQDLLMTNMIITFLFNLLNLIIINVADIRQKSLNSIYNSIFFKSKVLFFIIITKFTIIYIITQIILLNMNMKIKPINSNSIQDPIEIYQFPLGQIIQSMKVTHTDYKQLYIYDAYQISKGALLILFPFYQTLYVFEAIYLRTRVNYQLNSNNFIDYKQSNMNENDKQANIL